MSVLCNSLSNIVAMDTLNWTAAPLFQARYVINSSLFPIIISTLKNFGSCRQHTLQQSRLEHS
jgi:hypothetical protein